MAGMVFGVHHKVRVAAGFRWNDVTRKEEHPQPLPLFAAHPCVDEIRKTPRQLVPEDRQRSLRVQLADDGPDSTPLLPPGLTLERSAQLARPVQYLDAEYREGAGQIGLRHQIWM